MHATVSIPSWNAQGLLPPVDRANPVSPNRSPYPVRLTDVVLRFNTSAERQPILSGFLDYRAALHVAGLTVGFQWLDGSFVEHIEIGERRRAPAGADVVTFYRLPAGTTQQALVDRHPELFPGDGDGLQALKNRYKVDARTVHLGLCPERLVDRSAYWSGVWGHQRETFSWKGFLQIDLAPNEDADARALLASAPAEETP